MNRGLRVCMMLAAAVSAGEGVDAAVVTLSPGVRLAAVPATPVGLHTSVYANQWGNSGLPSKIAASGVQMLRYPGGSYSNGYYWNLPSQPGGNIYIAPNSDFGNFARVLSASSKVGMVTVNYGSAIGNTAGGTPEAAAAWVAYANATTSNTTSIGTDATGRNWFTAGYWASLRSARPLSSDDGLNFLRIQRSTPIGVKYWEVGNESFGNGYYGTNLAWENDKHSATTGTARIGDPLVSPTAYGTRFAQFAAKMKAVDPTVKVGAVLTGPGDTGDVSDTTRNWNRNVLAGAGASMDFGIVHFYPTNVASDPSQLLNAPANRLGTIISRLRSDVQTFGGRDPSSVEYHMTEFGNFGDAPTADLRAAYVASTYATATSVGFATSHYLEMSNGGFLSDTAALTPGGAYFGTQAVSQLIGDGGSFVSVSSNMATLRAFAVSQKDGQLAVMLVNQSQTTSEGVTLSIPGPATNYDGTLYAAGGAGLTTTAVTGLSSFGFGVTVPPNGVYTYVLTPSFAVVPEPAGMAVMACAGGLALGGRRRARR